MERATSVTTGMGEQSLTPGEQRILALMEQGQQRVEQRLDSMDQRLDRMDQRLDRMDQRLQSLEEGQQRMDQRLQSLKEGQQRMDQQLKELPLKVEQEAAASKTRDRELLSEVQRTRDATQTWSIWLLEQIGHSHLSTITIMQREMSNLRMEFSERFAQHDTRLRVVERTLERHDEHLREFGQSIQGLQQETRKLAAAVEHLAQAPRVAASP